jgi:predicted nucleotidyltransferase
MLVEEIRERIGIHRAELARLGVEALRLFGSHARGEAREDSDIDLVVAFTRPASFDDYMDLKLLLEDALERSVDLVTEAAILPRLKSRIDKEAIRVA